jgi:hypothetical protein
MNRRRHVPRLAIIAGRSSTNPERAVNPSDLRNLINRPPGLPLRERAADALTWIALVGVLFFVFLALLTEGAIAYAAAGATLTICGASLLVNVWRATR